MTMFPVIQSQPNKAHSAHLIEVDNLGTLDSMKAVKCRHFFAVGGAYHVLWQRKKG
jgi:hypothetical protein